MGTHAFTRTAGFLFGQENTDILDMMASLAKLVQTQVEHTLTPEKEFDFMLTAPHKYRVVNFPCTSCLTLTPTNTLVVGSRIPPRRALSEASSHRVSHRLQGTGFQGSYTY